MIVFITTRGHSYTVQALVSGRFGAPLPRMGAITYDRAFGAARLPRATYIFSDIERLAPWEQRLAATLHRRLGTSGMRCLNDPARVATRYELLRTLHASGSNPFTAYRAEDRPCPARFPVFIRTEADHDMPFGDLIATQDALELALAELPARGIPLRGLLVIEFCAEPIAPGAWRKFGSFRIGDGMHLDHAVVEDRWLVKYGKAGFATPAMFQAELDAVTENRHAAGLLPAFAAGAIEYGRADHATVGGREVVYEINTNPHIHAPTPQRSPLRQQTLAIAAARLAGLFRQIDSGDGQRVRLADPPLAGRRRQRLLAWLGRVATPARP